MLQIAFVTLAVLLVLFGVCAFVFIRNGREDEEQYPEDERQEESNEEATETAERSRKKAEKPAAEAGKPSLPGLEYTERSETELPVKENIASEAENEQASDADHMLSEEAALETEEGGINLVPVIAVATAVLVVLAIVAAALIITDRNRGVSDDVEEPDTITAVVENIRRETELDGEIMCENPEVRYFTANGKVTALNFKEGDRVKKGDVIYELDSSAISERIDLLKQRLENAVVTKENRVEKTERIKSETAGTVSRIYVSAGDKVSAGETVALISGPAECRVNLEFEGEAGKISQGDKAIVIAGGKSYEGTVSSVSESEAEDENGSVYKTVVIFKGNISSGTAASATVAGIKSSSNGQVQTGSVSLTEIKADHEGRIMSVDVRQNASVSQGTVVASLAYTETVSETKTDELEAKDIQIQIEQLETELKNYAVTADSDGYIQKLYVKADSNAAINSQAVVIIPDNSLYLSFSIKEENAEKMTIPTAASYKLVHTNDSRIPKEAWDGVDTEKEYNCVLEKMEKDSEHDGKYNCRVELAEQRNLYAGMKASVRVVTYTAYDALLVPEEYVRGGRLTLWRANKAEEIEVETGITTDDGYVEILKGINSMDKIVTGE